MSTKSETVKGFIVLCIIALSMIIASKLSYDFGHKRGYRSLETDIVYGLASWTNKPVNVGPFVLQETNSKGSKMITLINSKHQN